MKDKKLILLTGFACNHNCVMCSLSSVKQGGINRTTRQIMEDIEKGKKEGYKRVEFTGGEPAIRKDIFQLIRHAKSLGFSEIGIGSNGTIFYYPYICKKFVKSGLNRICVSLHGHVPAVHDAIARTPGAFKKSVQGIKNMLYYCSVNSVDVATVTSKINYKFLKNIGRFIFDSLGVRSWSILDLIPEGNANHLYDKLAVKLSYLPEIFYDIYKTLKQPLTVNFFDFPLCVFPSQMSRSKNVYFIAAKERKELADQRGYGSTRILNQKGAYIDKYKVRLPVCSNCMYTNSCGGIWKRYLELFGAMEFDTFSKNIKKIKNHAKNR